jgi:Dolichyl-phosphate-mannose-protein mannosyltransferase
LPLTTPLAGVLPAGTFLALAYALRPTTGQLRLGALRSAVLLGAAAVLAVEVMSALHVLTGTAMVALWSATLAATIAGAVVRHRHDRPTVPSAPLSRRMRALATQWTALSTVERLLVATIALLYLGEFVIAVLSPPNNYDSQTYHLPRIEHWAGNGSVAIYPTAIVRQVAMPPGAEYLLLHARLLTGGSAGYNLLQLAAGAGCALLAARITGQLGGARRAQLLAAFLVATAPIVALESTSTQTDLVLAFWVAAVATLVLDDVTGRLPVVGGGVLLGAAVGLVAITKQNGLDAVAPLLLLWLAVRIRRAGLARAAAGAALVGVVALALAAPYLLRVRAEYGNPLGPAYLTDPIAMQRHDPPAVLVNALRVTHGAVQTPVVPANDALARAVDGLGRLLGVAPDDPAITYPDTTFPTPTWAPDEDRASFPASAVPALLGTAFLLVRPAPRVPTERVRVARAYAGALGVAALLYVAMVKWQPWGNRLVIFLLVLAAAPAALWLDAALRRPAPGTVRRAVVGGVTAAVLATGAAAGLASVGYGWPRRLVGTGSVFTGDEQQRLFQRRPQWLPQYQQAAAAVRASGARRVGLVEGYDAWEYPWFVLLPDTEIVSLRSLQPHTPAPAPGSVDAIVCVRAERLCRERVPAGWQLHMLGDVGYALP